MKYNSESRDFSRIPDAMKQARRWVCWDENKKPVNPITLSGAQPNNPGTWSTFAIAEAAIGKPCVVAGEPGTVQGVGFMMGDGWTGIDLDGGAEHGSGEVPQSVIDAFTALGTYTEYSKSGSGYHVIGLYRGERLEGSSFTWKEGTPEQFGVEMYFSGRYFAITGNVYGAVPAPIVDISADLPALHEKYIAKPKREEAQKSTSASYSTVSAPAGEQREFLQKNIVSLLNAIDPDSPRDIWYKVGAALKWEGFDYSLFDEWSARGSKYKGQRDTISVWNSFHRGGVDGGYIVKQAMNNGWSPEHVTDSYKAKNAAQDFAGIAPAPENGSQPAQAAPVYHFANAGESLDRFLQMTGAKDYKPIPTGFSMLDRAINGGFDPGTMSIIMAAPATGKTALVMQIAENIARSGLPVMVFNLEMGVDQLIARSLSRLTAECALEDEPAKNPLDFGAVSGVQAMYSNQWWTLNPAQKRRLQQAKARLTQYAANLFLVTDAIKDYTDIITRVKAFKAQTGKAPVAIVDYLQLLFVDGKTSAVYSAKDVALGLKQEIARDLQTHVILLSATGRDKAKGKDLDMQSAFGSSFIEYSADYLFGMQRVDPERLVYHDHKTPLELTLIKGRMTPPDAVQGFWFMGAYSHFGEMLPGDLQTAKAAVSAAKREREKDNQKEGQQAAPPPKTTKKPI